MFICFLGFCEAMGGSILIEEFPKLDWCVKDPSYDFI